MPVTQWENLNYSEQLNAKVETFGEKLSALTSLPISVFESPETGYRMRSEFRVWHEKADTHYAMYRPGTKELYYLESFPAASTSIQALMPKLMEQIRGNETLRHRLFNVEFLSTQTGEILVTLIYHRQLDKAWEAEANLLQNALSIYILGRSKKQKIVLEQDYVTETLKVDGRNYRYRQFENSFTQPNAKVNEKMLAWACDQAKNLGGDLIELYCGNGNFTLPLARYFNQVLTTEISKSSIAALSWNLDENNIPNVSHARLSAEEITQAIDRVRPFRRLSHINLDNYNFSTIFVDPPRAGIDENTMRLLARFDNIIYISCNPETLIPNLEQLEGSHQIQTVAAFDQFPFTHHLETGVLLQRKAT